MESLPGPLFPPLINRPLSLSNTDQYKSLLNIKQSFCEKMKNSLYFITTNDTEKFNFNSTIERYSDKYSKKKKYKDDWQPDWTILPHELKFFYEKNDKLEKRKAKRLKKPNVCKKDSKKVDLKKIIDENMDNIKIKIELEENDEENENEENDNDNDDEDKKSKENEENSDKEDLENEEEEDLEEENDYIDTYFDNGENYDDADLGGGDDDGPVY